MRMTYDECANAAYIYVVNEIASGEVAETRICGTPKIGTSVNCDFDSVGRLLGIELLGVSALLAPEVLDALRNVQR